MMMAMMSRSGSSEYHGARRDDNEISIYPVCIGSAGALNGKGRKFHSLVNRCGACLALPIVAKGKQRMDYPTARGQLAG